MKRLLLILFLFSTTGGLMAQEVPDLDRAMRIAKAQYPQVDSIDRVYYNLHYFDSIPPSSDQQLKLMEIYKNISNGYAANFHFKQAYNAFHRYLSLKEKKLSSEKTEIIRKLKDEYDQKDGADEAEVATLQSQAQQLNSDIESLISRRSLFKNVFSIIIAILSLMFAWSLFRSGMKLKSYLDETQSNRNKVLQNHRITALGSLAKGMKHAISSNIEKIGLEAKEVLNDISKGTSKISLLKTKLDEIVKALK